MMQGDSEGVRYPSIAGTSPENKIKNFRVSRLGKYILIRLCGRDGNPRIERGAFSVCVEIRCVLSFPGCVESNEGEEMFCCFRCCPSPSREYPTATTMVMEGRPPVYPVTKHHGGEVYVFPGVSAEMAQTLVAKTKKPTGSVIVPPDQTRVVVGGARRVADESGLSTRAVTLPSVVEEKVDLVPGTDSPFAGLESEKARLSAEKSETVYRKRSRGICNEVCVSAGAVPDADRPPVSVVPSAVPEQGRDRKRGRGTTRLRLEIILPLQ